jgi:hypothetical protein
MPECPLLAQSGHLQLYRTCPLSGVNETSFVTHFTMKKVRLFAQRTRMDRGDSAMNKAIDDRTESDVSP